MKVTKTLCKKPGEGYPELQLPLNSGESGWAEYTWPVDWVCLSSSSFQKHSLPRLSLATTVEGGPALARSWASISQLASCLLQASIISVGYFGLWPWLIFPTATPWLVTFLPWFIKNLDKSPNTSLLTFFLQTSNNDQSLNVACFSQQETLAKHNNWCVHGNI